MKKWDFNCLDFDGIAHVGKHWSTTPHLWIGTEFTNKMDGASHYTSESWDWEDKKLHSEHVHR